MRSREGNSQRRRRRKPTSASRTGIGTGFHALHTSELGSEVILPILNLESWTRKAETLEVGKNLEYFRQDVGLKVDRRGLSRLERSALAHSQLFVKSFGREPEPLFMMSANTIGDAKTYDSRMKFHETRISKIVSKKYKMNGAPVNWGSWRQFAASTDDSASRKELFDDFLGKSRSLVPHIRARFDGFAKAVAAYGLQPLEIYLNAERIGYERLTSFVGELGSDLKPVFERQLGHFSEEILGRDAEYYDDFYFFRARIFRKYAESFPVKTDAITQIIRTMKWMGLDATRIKVDSVDRKGKSASPFCSGIRVPSDVRISYRKSNPLEDFSGIFHEFGHGIHFSSIGAGQSYWNRYYVSMGVAEIFSIFFEGLLHDRRYLRDELGLSEEVASDLMSRFTFNQLFFVTFYSANSMMKLRYWHDALSMDEATRLYAELTERYMGIRYPGEYWYLHHVLPEYILYSPSYLLAAVRANELVETLRSRFGEKYWRDPGSGGFLMELMRVGREIPLDRFSHLDVNSYVRLLGQRLA
jgi:hypothetical protein